MWTLLHIRYTKTHHKFTMGSLNYNDLKQHFIQQESKTMEQLTSCGKLVTA